MDTARKSQKSVKLMRTYPSRHEFRYLLIKYGRGLRPLPEEGGGLRPPPSFRFTLGSKSDPGGIFLIHFDCLLMFSGVPWSRRFLGPPENSKIHHFDHLGIFQAGHPENSKIHDFYHFGTVQIGHPENPILHNLDHFSCFPDFTERNGSGTLQA